MVMHSLQALEGRDDHQELGKILISKMFWGLERGETHDLFIVERL